MNSVQLSFFTPVIRNDSKFMNFVEKYTSFSEYVCHIVAEDQEKSLGLIKFKETSLGLTILKVISMLLTLGLSAIIAIAIRFISRRLNKPIHLTPPPIVALREELEMIYTQVKQFNNLALVPRELLDRQTAIVFDLDQKSRQEILIQYGEFRMALRYVGMEMNRFQIPPLKSEKLLPYYDHSKSMNFETPRELNGVALIDKLKASISLEILHVDRLNQHIIP
jgi:hypothetical protein